MTDDYPAVLREYIGTALWSSLCNNESCEYLDEKYDIDDFDKETLKKMEKELNEFIEKFFFLVEEPDRDTTVGAFATDFWFTRNGHGAGFWDGDYKNGDQLTEACEKYGAQDLYVGDDGKIYALKMPRQYK
ncbi:MAG: hypothetical protein U9R12_04395 [Candidatus Caldatribacteriota bacterium]|nr:hypothetical protein [Candidatus Caldatribacteriota bacterium]